MITKKTVTMPFFGADGTATTRAADGRIFFGRPGLLRAIKLDMTGQPVGMDGTVKDETGNTIITLTNTGATVLGPSSVVVDGVSDDGAALVDLAQGAPFRSGLQVAFTSGDVGLDPASLTDDAAAIVTVWVEV